MLTQLLESSPRRRGRQYGVIVSVIGHALALSGAVVAAHPVITPREPDRVIVWHPPTVQPPCDRCGPPSPTRSPGAAPRPLPSFPREPLGELTVDVPTHVDVGDPTIAISRDEWRAEVGASSGEAPPPGSSRAIVDREVVPHPSNPTPRYPEQLRMANIEGQVHAQFVVDTTGRVVMESVAVQVSPHPAFSAAVVEALRHARFTPAEFRGRKVAQLVSQPFVFRLRAGR